jgi:hypothetical protein
LSETDPETPPPDDEIPPSEEREQCPGHETEIGTVTHVVYPRDCIADGFDV